MSEWIKRLAAKNTFQSKVEVDENGEHFIRIPDVLLEKTGWEIGDELEAVKINPETIRVNKKKQ